MSMTKSGLACVYCVQLFVDIRMLFRPLSLAILLWVGAVNAGGGFGPRWGRNVEFFTLYLTAAIERWCGVITWLVKWLLYGDYRYRYCSCCVVGWQAV